MDCSSSASRESRESSSDGDIACPPSKVIRRLWHDEWKDMYPWARYDTATGRMYCQVCTDLKKDNTLCFPGTNHEKSKKHKEAISENSMKNTLPQCMLRQVARVDRAWGTSSAQCYG